MSSTQEAPLQIQLGCRVGEQGNRFDPKISSLDLNSRKSIVRSVSFANDLLIYLEIFPAFIRVYVAVIAVILSPEIRGDRSGDTSPTGDTSQPKTKPSVLIQFTTGLDVRLYFALRSVTFSGSVTEVSPLPAQCFSSLEGKR